MTKAGHRIRDVTRPKPIGVHQPVPCTCGTLCYIFMTIPHYAIGLAWSDLVYNVWLETHSQSDDLRPGAMRKE